LFLLFRLIAPGIALAPGFLLPGGIPAHFIFEPPNWNPENPVSTEIRELRREEFPLAEKVWEHYRGQKADPEHERIYGAFVDGDLAATARCTHHPDGMEMDCVFTLDAFRGRGYARKVVAMLLKSCGSDRRIFIHSTLALVSFYKSLGFRPIPESSLPQSIRERFAFCFGEMEGCNVAPMARDPQSHQ
jgi:N-acetylglutamate synthase-like GNAT family acetyltransferase